jgi:iron complex outermembrane receptor protein
MNQVAPGLHVTSTISDRNNVTFNIRGQGYAYGTVFPAVIPYFAEVPITANFSNGNLFDLESVQVLRGPQGVQFGRVTDGGAVLVQPKRPTNFFEGYAEAQAGDYGMYGFEGALNVPLVADKLLLRVAGQSQKRDGFTTNIFNGKKLDDVDYQTWRVGLSFRPTDYVDSYTVIQYNQSNDNGTATKLAEVNPVAVRNSTGSLFGGLGFAFTGLLGPGVPLTTDNFVTALQNQLALQTSLGPRKTNISMPVFSKRHNFYVVNNTTIDVSDDIRLRNIFGYTRAWERQASDFDGSTVPYIDTTHAFLPYVDQEQVSEEFQVQGKAFESRLNYTAGVYLDYQGPAGPAENYTINLGILQRNIVNYQTTRSTAGYLQAEYDLGDFVQGLKVNGGVRRTWDTYRAQSVNYIALQPNPFIPEPPMPHGVCTSFRSNALGPATCSHLFQKFAATTWSFGASEQFTPDHFGYLKYSRGYRPGGGNPSAPDPSQAAYQPEYDKSFEIGIKSDWSFWDMRARTNLALFRDRYSNIQKLNVVVGAGGIPASVISNAAKAKVQGVEFEGTLIPVRNLTLGVQYAYTDAHFINSGAIPDSVLFGDAAVTPVPGAGACNPQATLVFGYCPYNPFNGTPKNTVSFDAHYTLPIGDSVGDVTFGGSLYHQSSMFMNDTGVLTPRSYQPAYTLLNLDASWDNVMGSPVTVRAFITNVTNKLYRVGRNDLSNNGSVGVAADVWAPPRMFGFAVRYRFGT